MRMYTKKQTLRAIKRGISYKWGWCVRTHTPCDRCPFITGSENGCEFERIRDDLGIKDYDDSVLELALCVENSPI